jgi:sigma-B regulation protein RsbQ
MSNLLERHHVKVGGNLEAPETLFFIHGFGTDQTVWHALIPYFEVDYRWVLMDNAGAGRFDMGEFDMGTYRDLSAYAEDVQEVADALNLSGAILVGHSVGAMIGAMASVKSTGLFSKLIFIGASPRYLNDTGYHGGFTQDDLNKIHDSMVYHYAHWADHFAPWAIGCAQCTDLALAFAESLKSIPEAIATSVLYSIFTSDFRRLLPKITYPTLLIHTQNDALVPQAVADYLHQHIEHSTLRIVDTEGHLPHFTAPEKLYEPMRGYLENGPTA